VSRLTPNDKNEAINILVNCFDARDPMNKALRVSKGSMSSFLHASWDSVIGTGCSVVVRTRDTDELVGALFMADMETHPPPENLFADDHKPVGEFLEMCEHAADSHLRGKVVTNFIAGPKVHLSSEENSLVFYMMEKEVCQLSKECGFETIVAVNLNPVSIDLAKILGYEVVGEFQLNQFVLPNEEKPFAMLGDDFFAKTCVRYL